MQKYQPVAAGLLAALVHLPGSAGFAVDDLAGELSRYIERLIGTAAIGNYDFDSRLIYRCKKSRECIVKVSGFIKGWHHNAD